MDVSLEIFVWAFALWAGSGLLGAIVIGVYLALARTSEKVSAAGSKRHGPDGSRT